MLWAAEDSGKRSAPRAAVPAPAASAPAEALHWCQGGSAHVCVHSEVPVIQNRPNGDAPVRYKLHTHIAGLQKVKPKFLSREKERYFLW